ncbi:MAG: hypothetical protein P4L53_18445 [Candidatus Obscuribacterales bacterium]|nr:hypothetical protein [Candidatus Obscuribacterales bacterium]
MTEKKQTDLKIGRDAKTGEFITVAEANRRPATTIVQTIKHTPTAPTTKIGRDAKTGEFITVAEAKRRPATTVVQTIKHAPTNKKK